MPSTNNAVYKQFSVGSKTPFVALSPLPVLANYAPLGNTNSQQGTLWIELSDINNNLVNAVFINTGKWQGVNQWINLSGGAGSFTNLSANNILLPYSTATVGRIEFGGIATVIVPEITSIFVGQAAGNVTYTGDHNSALGELALSALTTGSDNTAVGYEAGTNITTGISNALLGSTAGVALTTGSHNAVVGAFSLTSATTSSINSVLGAASLTGVTTGTGGNIAIGTTVLNGITTGTANIGIGNLSGSALVTGTESGNIYINDIGVNGESNMMRISSNGGAIINTTGATSTLELHTNGLVQVDAVLATVASPTAGWTANQRVTRGLFTGFTTAAAGTQAFTLTSSVITATSVILCTVTNLNASTNGAMMGIQGITQAAGSIIVHTVNNGAGALGAGDNVLVSVWILD